MERIKGLSRAVWRGVWFGLVVVARASRAVLAAFWRGTMRGGRVLLWILFLPVGVWRSVVHGRRRRDRDLASMIADAATSGSRKL